MVLNYVNFSYVSRKVDSGGVTSSSPTKWKRGVISPWEWDTCEVRVKESVTRIPEPLDSFDRKATFFVLGWLAERCPDLVREIHGRGHEVASHGYSHVLIHHQSPSEFREDISRAKKTLEGIIGERVLGYRNPPFPLRRWNSARKNPRFHFVGGVDEGGGQNSHQTDHTDRIDQTDEFVYPIDISLD